MIMGRYSEHEANANALVAKMGEKPFSQEVEDEAIAAVAAALKATKRVRQRDAEGKIVWVDVPDHPLRGAMGIKVIEHNLGKPKQRIMSVHADLTPGTAPDPLGQLLDLALEDDRTTAEIIEKIREEHRKRRKGVIDVTPRLPKPGKPGS